ncbi:MAG: hypothetical protein RBR59_00370 [Sulfurimonadaceae bacterium]|jgi:hypothetical protein|nr:hypothetical protein [Sulfurimonadaceae bacterium]
MKTFISCFIILFLFLGCTKQKTAPLHKLTLSEHGINGINHITPYNRSFISSKLLGYEIALYNKFENQTTQSLMRVSYEGQEIMLLLPSQQTKEEDATVESIIITSKYVKNLLGLEIGTPLKRELFMACTENKNEILCKENPQSNISWIFTKTNSDTPKLLEIIWTKNSDSL